MPSKAAMVRSSWRTMSSVSGLPAQKKMVDRVHPRETHGEIVGYGIVSQGLADDERLCEFGDQRAASRVHQHLRVQQAVISSPESMGEDATIAARIGLVRTIIERRRTKYRENPDPHFLTFGPKNRRKFLANRKARGESPD